MIRRNSRRSIDRNISWQPNNISDLAAWYRADRSVAKAGALPVMLFDLSGRNCNVVLSGGTVTTQISNPLFNNMPTFTMASNTIGTCTTEIVKPGTDRTVIIIAAGVTSAGAQVVQFSRDDNHRLAFSINIQSTSCFYAYGPGVTYAIVQQQNTPGIASGFGAVFSYTAATTAPQLRYNGITLGNITETVSADDLGTTLPGAIFFAPVSGIIGAQPMICAEMVIYSRLLTSREISEFSTYASLRYNKIV